MGWGVGGSLKWWGGDGVAAAVAGCCGSLVAGPVESSDGEEEADRMVSVDAAAADDDWRSGNRNLPAVESL